jgi:TPR repeat protein
MAVDSSLLVLGYAYDVGLGTKRDIGQALRWYRRAARNGQSTAASNIATIFRDAGKSRLAFRWWKRSSDLNDGDAAVDLGYCYQYGIGTRRNLRDAQRLFKKALKSANITEYGREEAMYQLALGLIDKERRDWQSLYCHGPRRMETITRHLRC